MRTGGTSSSDRNPAGRAGYRTTMSFAWTTPTTPAFSPALPEVSEGQTRDDGEYFVWTRTFDDDSQRHPATTTINSRSSDRADPASPAPWAPAPRRRGRCRRAAVSAPPALRGTPTLDSRAPPRPGPPRSRLASPSSDMNCRWCFPAKFPFKLSCFQTINILNSNNLAFKSAFKGVSDR